jgi:hypothetical protein
MSFKKFIDFILEKKKGDKHAIEDVKADAPPIDTEVPLVCPKCGELAKTCDCYVDDYYNAKTPQYMPKGIIIKNPKNEKTK